LNPSSCLDALQSFYSQMVEVKTVRDRLFVSLPLVNSDGYQISVGIEQISDKYAVLTDLGETLAFLECRGISTQQESLSELIDKHLKTFEIERHRDELSKAVSLPIQGLDIHLFGEALSGLTYLLFRHGISQASNFHVLDSIRRSLEHTKLDYVEGKNAWISGKTEKSIQVDFLIAAKARVAIKTVQRRGRMHDYMEQWGFRWIDAKEAEPTLVRAMFYDPENQEWDENSVAIGTRHCEIFRPYFEDELIRSDLTRLALAA
jgi:Domain of unknown function DUF1828